MSRVTESDPRTRRIHVVGEVHPGELAERGYARIGEEWVLEIRRPAAAAGDADPFVAEFEALGRMGYGFAEGDEWSPRELWARFKRSGEKR